MSVLLVSGITNLIVFLFHFVRETKSEIQIQIDVNVIMDLSISKFKRNVKIRPALKIIDGMDLDAYK